MPFLAPLVPVLAGIGGGSAAAGGALLGGSVASSVLGARGGKSTSTRTMTPEQQRINSLFADRLGGILADPRAGTEPIRTQLLDQVNRRYAGVGDRVTESLASRGFGRSGKLGGALKGLEFERMRGLSDVESEIARLILGREESALGLANSFIGGPAASTTTTYPGNKLGAGIGAGVEGLSTILMLKNLGVLGGGGGGGGGYGDV